MQWLFNFDPQEWLAPLRQSPWMARVQVLLSAGIGLTGLGMYLAAECLRRLVPSRVARSRE